MHIPITHYYRCPYHTTGPTVHPFLITTCTIIYTPRATPTISALNVALIINNRMIYKMKYILCYIYPQGNSNKSIIYKMKYNIFYAI